MDGFFKENGAILWPSGSPYPVLNPWSFHHLTNVVWVDQPVGTGYSQGNVTAQDEGDIARQFLGFWKNFIDTFEMEGYKVYITGESYAGMYCPYIAHEMIKANDSKYFDVDGMMIYDPSIGSGILTEMSTKYFHDSWKHAIPLNDTAAAALEEMADKCNYTTYLDEYLTYPPSKAQPDVDTLPAASDEECDAQNFLINAALEINPGFNLYQITQLPPVPWDVEGFPYSDFYTYPNTSIYFDRPDVKKALHVSENVKWEICSTGSVFVGGDSSLPSALHEIPAVIESTNNVQIHHGVLDFVLTVNATLLTIQNMTWNGAMGLSEMPREPLFVPYHENSFVPTSAGAGVLGSWVEQRGLTVGIVTLTGHMIPEWVPGIAFRQIEVLLRRVENLASTKPFPQSPKSPQPKASGLGRGTAGTNWGRVLKT
ncbi:hypothetical protein GMORB2_7832 [Geosmithia morbida]|uniref:Carboxypeptidase n=1 Tax=Geosmithia morbida TaxID=1094350 RepID=A0A9P5D584_9HYPO|nr:uncharacterized protein GMORB2_7832 [Geosmithia morbida]KAF4122239.1 hypothetical protein GMORB2_7832 [Geosmithia morbida]